MVWHISWCIILHKTFFMPDKSTIEKAKKDKQEGKSASTQAGEFVHDEIEKVKKGKHGVRSAKQAIAIGLSEARRSGVQVPAPKKGSTALKKEPTNTVSKKALSKQAKSAAKKRTASQRSASAKKAAKTREKNNNK